MNDPSARSGPSTAAGRRARALLPDVVALGAPFAVAAIGAVVTASAIPTWYRGLRKPGWNPPDWVFGPVWTTLYLLMGLALVIARRASSPRERRRHEAIFAVQLALNLAWTLVFFGRRSIAGGLVVIAALWVAIVATVARFRTARPLAAALMLPYLGWVTFAAALNARIWRLNDR